MKPFRVKNAFIRLVFWLKCYFFVVIVCSWLHFNPILCIARLRSTDILCTRCRVVSCVSTIICDLIEFTGSFLHSACWTLCPKKLNCKLNVPLFAIKDKVKKQWNLIYAKYYRKRRENSRWLRFEHWNRVLILKLPAKATATHTHILISYAKCDAKMMLFW